MNQAHRWQSSPLPMASVTAVALLALGGGGHSLHLHRSWAPEAFPQLPERWMCWRPLGSSPWPWTSVHEWYLASHLRSWGPGWAEPCCCLVLRRFLVSGKRRHREISLSLSSIFLNPFFLVAQEALQARPPSSSYHLPPCSLGSRHISSNKPSSLLPQDL